MPPLNNQEWRFLTLTVTVFFVALGLLVPNPICAQAPLDQAWSILQSDAADKSSDQRTATMRVLQLIPGDAKAVGMAEKGLQDQKPDVRAAAALSLGAMKAKSAIPRLEQAARKDTEGAVSMAAAKSLVQLGDEKGYEVFYAVLTGQRKSGESLVGSEEKELDQLLQNPKQMETMAFEQGIGFVPFGGYGLQVFDAIHASESKEPIVKAAAIKMLATDPDPLSGKALVAATTDKDSLVRAAAFQALAKRGDAALLPDLASGLKDEKEEVKLTAAAAVIHLSTVSNKGRK
ncbi:MAG TPA: HEAT repeat domain-containing protein [Terriglobia bacterium]